MFTVLFNHYAVRVLVVLAAILSITTWYYQGRYQSTRDELLILKHNVKQQSDNSKAMLKALTAERDAKQLIINQKIKNQDKEDAQKLRDITNTKLHTVSVRIKPNASVCPNSAAGGAQNTSTGTTDTTATAGLLSDTNTRQLEQAIVEIETMSAAYSSCRATLMPQ
jgi:hypothetical protein